MCLIVFAYKIHPDYDLILAANRDEAYRRPTRPAQFWNDYPSVLAGKDLKAGGTWMGINKMGGFAALTNYRDPAIVRDNPPSRGRLVLDYLTDEINAESYLKNVNTEDVRYMGFNLLAGSVKQFFHYSNQEKKLNRIESGIHGLSNHLLDTPWPKVEKAKKKLKKIIPGSFNEEAFFELLGDDIPADEEKLPDTGIGKKFERQVSPIFIKSEHYGTRNSTILLIDKSGKVVFEERRFKARTQKVDEKNRFEFKINRKIRV